MFWCVTPSPLGELTLASDGSSLTGLWIANQAFFGAGLSCDAVCSPDLPVFQITKTWLTAYFAQKPLPQLPPLNPMGTPFRQAVWRKLAQIPEGTTVTYGIIADQLNKEGISASPRAVGGAVGRNPISIIIPCHRVVGAGGKLTGYAGGLQAKTYLLELEGIYLENRKGIK